MHKGIHIHMRLHNTNTDGKRVYFKIMVIRTTRPGENTNTNMFAPVTGTTWNPWDWNANEIYDIWAPINKKKSKVIWSKKVLIGYKGDTLFYNHRTFSKYVKINRNLVMNQEGSATDRVLPRYTVVWWVCKEDNTPITALDAEPFFHETCYREFYNS